MTTPAQVARPSRKPWPDRWLLDAFPDVAATETVAASTAVSAWEALEEAGVSRRRVLAAARRISGVETTDVSGLGPDRATLLPVSLAKRFDVVPVGHHGRTLLVATADPLGRNPERELAFASGRRISVLLASPEEIREARQRVYGLQPVAGPTRIAWVSAGGTTGAPELQVRGQAVELLDRLLLDALDQRASDLHFEPDNGELLVRYRIDGVLHDISRVPAGVTPQVLSRIKIAAGLDIANRLRPQDGRATLRVDGRAVDLRVSTLPLGERVEKAVVRILDAGTTALDFESLGFTASERDQLARILAGSEGMVLVTGPTGSGKTTTLYSALRHMQSRETNVVTVEDPIEYQLEGISQVQVNERAGLSFAAALRSILRQDPDVVLVGEIRDVETATIAIRASMTGHMVLSTLHTNDAPSAIGRLADMGVDMSTLSGALKAVIAQRLVRRLCPACCVPQELEELPRELHWVFRDRDVSMLRRASGCPACRGTGYRGRMVVAEMLVIDDETQQLMSRTTQRLEFLGLARRRGMHTLWATGLDRVLQGQTSFAELISNLTPPIPDAELQQEDVDRLLADLVGGGAEAAQAEAGEVTPSPERPVRAPSTAGASPVAADGPDVAATPVPAEVHSGGGGAVTPVVPVAEVPAAAVASVASVAPVAAIATEAPVIAAAPRRPVHHAEAGRTIVPPVAEGARPAPPARLAIAPRVRDGRPRVLLAMECMQRRRALRAALVRVGCGVVEAANGDAALAYACRLRPDAVVTELAMPGLDGLGLLQILRTEEIVPHVYVLTEQDDAALSEWARELGAQEVLATAHGDDTIATLVLVDCAMGARAAATRPLAAA